MGKKWKNMKKKPQTNPLATLDEGGRPIRGAGYEDIVKENAMFEEFYKRQGIVPAEEFSQFMSVLREPLPASFRISGTRSQSQALLQLVQNDFLGLVEKQSMEGDSPSEEVKHVCLPWYPDQLAYQLNITRGDIRKSEAYHKLHNFLISETESGNISRQETVSMLPPLVLDVQPHHKVLDMCAAPGSKTAQLIEALHADDAPLPAGMVVANDADNKRCYMLVHQAKRLQSPCFCITNHDAASMPNVYTSDGCGGQKKLLFDRVLCDVPCSGDGTLRKNTDVWPKWNPANGCNLHGLQFNIAMRGLEMLAEGGRLVYSTCSLNPIEDEAVVDRILRESKGTVRLVDASGRLPGLKFSPGLTSWVNFSKDMVLYERAADIAAEHQTLIRPHMFPSEPPNTELTKCMRILPHQQNTGGFFLAVLEKVGSTADASTAASNTASQSEPLEGAEQGEKRTAGGPPPKKKHKRARGYKEDPYFFVKEGDAMLKELQEFYGLSGEFDHGLLMTRCEQGKKKNIYLCSPAVRDLITQNQERIKIINCGVKVFARCDNKNTPCGHRLAQEGSDSILPFLTKRKVRVTAEDLGKILQYDDIELPCEFKNLDSATQEEMSKSGPGAVALLVDAAVPPGRLVRTHVVGWKGATSVRGYVQRNERIHYLRLLGADTSKYEKNKFAQARAQEEKAAAAEKDASDEVSMEKSSPLADQAGDGGSSCTVDRGEETNSLKECIKSSNDRTPVQLEILDKGEVSAGQVPSASAATLTENGSNGQSSC